MLWVPKSSTCSEGGSQNPQNPKIRDFNPFSPDPKIAISTSYALIGPKKNDQKKVLKKESFFAGEFFLFSCFSNFGILDLPVLISYKSKSQKPKKPIFFEKVVIFLPVFRLKNENCDFMILDPFYNYR